MSLAAAVLLSVQRPELAECLQPRGEVVVKGKGPMEMFFLCAEPQRGGKEVCHRLQKLAAATRDHHHHVKGNPGPAHV